MHACRCTTNYVRGVDCAADCLTRCLLLLLPIDPISLQYGYPACTVRSIILLVAGGASEVLTVFSCSCAAVLSGELDLQRQRRLSLIGWRRLRLQRRFFTLRTRLINDSRFPIRFHWRELQPVLSKLLRVSACFWSRECFVPEAFLYAKFAHRFDCCLLQVSVLRLLRGLDDLQQLRQLL